MQIFRLDDSVNWEELISMILQLRGISRSELATRVRCTEGDLEDWARGIGVPPPEIAERLWRLSPHARSDEVLEHALDPELMGEGSSDFEPE